MLTFLYRFMPDLIKEGHVYLAQPPLYKIEKNKNVWYAYSDDELNAILTEIGRDGNNKIQIYMAFFDQIRHEPIKECQH